MNTNKYTLPKDVMIQGEQLAPDISTGDFEVLLVGENDRQKADKLWAPVLIGKLRFELSTGRWYLNDKWVDIEDIQDALMEGLMNLRKTYLFENHVKNKEMNKGE